MRRGSLVLVALLFLALAPPVAAGRTKHCETLGWTSIHAGDIGGGSDLTKVAASVYIRGTPALAICTIAPSPPPDLLAASSAWVALQSGQHADDIAQVGIIRCRGLPWCGDNKVHYFWSYGSHCTRLGVLPVPLDLGPVNDTATHHFRVEKVGTTVRFYIDAVEKRRINWSEISCWASSRAQAFYACEVGDRGDACGGSSTSKLEMFSAYRKDNEGGSYVVAGFSAPCAYTSSRFSCSVKSSSSLLLWTVQP